LWNKAAKIFTYLICMYKVGLGGLSSKFGLGLLLNKLKAQAQTGLGLGVGPRAWAYLVKARAWPEPEVYSPSPKFSGPTQS
jgi:hypothetical protein